MENSYIVVPILLTTTNNGVHRKAALKPKNKKTRVPYSHNILSIVLLRQKEIKRIDKGNVISNFPLCYSKRMEINYDFLLSTRN